MGGQGCVWVEGPGLPWLHDRTGRRDSTWMVGRHKIGGKASGRTMGAQRRLGMCSLGDGGGERGLAGVTNAPTLHWDRVGKGGHSLRRS